MAYTERLLTGDGTAGPFAIGFNYLKASTVKVQLTDAFGIQTYLSFTFTGTPSEAQPSGTAVLLDTPAPSGASVRIYKDISLDTLLVDWLSGAELSYDNLRTSSVHAMEQAQAAYDTAVAASDLVNSISLDLDTLSSDVAAVISNATTIVNAAIVTTSQAVTDAHYWADIASAGAAVANPSAVAEAARDAAIAARDAAIAARDIAVSAKDLAVSSKNTAVSSASSATASATLADDYANKAKNSTVVAGKYSAKHYAETAQDIVNAGALRWNGSAKFVATTDPDPAQGVNGDFWFKREV